MRANSADKDASGNKPLNLRAIVATLFLLNSLAPSLLLGLCKCIDQTLAAMGRRTYRASRQIDIVVVANKAVGA